jgi:hypothetical protein
MISKFIVDVDAESKKVILRRFRPDGSEASPCKYTIEELIGGRDTGYFEIWENRTYEVPSNIISDMKAAIELLQE